MTTDTDEPLDFEYEDPPAISNKKKKVIGLDDLLNDFYKENKVTKRSKVQKAYDSDDEIDAREATFHNCVNEFQQKMNQIKADDEMPLWGLQVFGYQKTLPKLDFPELTRCRFLQSFLKNELNSLVELKTDEGQSFLEGLLKDGWLLKLISSHGRLERSIAKWSFNMLLYSPQQQLGAAACSFWCRILLSKTEIDLQHFEIEWLPDYSELIRALDVYGFLLDAPSKSSSSMELDHLDSDSSGPPQNIRSWIKFVSVICQRNMCSVFSTEEVEDLIVVIICMFMDRQLLGLSLILDECLHSLISFFNESEFDVSCVKIAKSLTCRLATDISCLRAVDSISALDARSKRLKSAVAFEFLVACFDSKVSDAEGILKSIISINLRDESYDLQKMYIYLILVENWLYCDPMLKDNPELIEMWAVCLRNCTCQISSTDLRSYALKVRSKASYLSQGNAKKW
nr:SMC5-SMC6 complex localization factor protein [Ipomoea batatas]